MEQQTQENLPKKQARKPQSRLARNVKFGLGLTVGLALAGALAGGWWLRQAWQDLPNVEHLAQYKPALPLRIFSSEGELLAEYGEERREFLPLQQIPLRMRQALLAIEDARFYEHGAVDFLGLTRATLANVVTGRHAQGASTITMQVARGFFLSRDKTVQRKLTEMLLAYKLEQHYGKDKLLELYMNQIYLGERSYGFSAASNIYFDKPLAELTVAEAAMLAGLPKAPSAYNPVANPTRAKLRQRYILQRMRELGDITQAEYDAAVAEPLLLNQSRNSSVQAAAYAVEEARQLILQSYPEGAYSMGLDVTTTIRMAPQRAADQALRNGLLNAQARRGYRGPEARLPASSDSVARQLSPYPDSGELQAALVRKVDNGGKRQLTAQLRNGDEISVTASETRLGGKLPLEGKLAVAEGSVIRVVQGQAKKHWLLTQMPEMEGAVISVDAQSGEIVAMAGGFDFYRNHYNHATQAYRQPGSSFKPFVYSAALEKGYFPGSEVDDTQRLLLPQETGAQPWRPRNYGDNYEGFISVRRGLVRSKNLVAVSLMQASGPAYVQQFSTGFGFDSARNPVSLPLALGAGAVTPLQLAQAYSVFANEGVQMPPKLIKEVRSRGGAVLFSDAGPRPKGEEITGTQIISARNAYVMDSMLRDVVKSGTGRGALALGRSDAAGKTGTSNNAYDAWFAGYSSGLVSVVWLGYDQPKSLGNATGGTLALPVWRDYMQVAVQGRREQVRSEPEGLAMLDGDYVYAEYLDGDCVQDNYDFIHSSVSCGSAKANEARSLSEAREREQILKSFSEE
ncbi:MULTISPECIES: penicillin-binding protein 1A [unclassified Janthinobacterium]|uniref:penicillin-binding protein 1A n=1 Tax=unclassified Janthinobacterium TaxID=2610881 RepID=UPI001608621B|nr:MULTISPECIES: PBP1A family penicillin-binding protein [unclassified Janthinobacterium]MBB5610229.1 penicillin-binding protein 1A [Janthinobacterium sp. S3T4]MBB5615597.1 penicillin-binding protein 1A [Janthinobacterium sp. S3M3]